MRSEKLNKGNAAVVLAPGEYTGGGAAGGVARATPAPRVFTGG
jgi:hypothetical protein